MHTCIYMGSLIKTFVFLNSKKFARVNNQEKCSTLKYIIFSLSNLVELIYITVNLFYRCIIIVLSRSDGTFTNPTCDPCIHASLESVLVRF